MRRRKLLIALAAAALFAARGRPASAELHRVSVTLVNGQSSRSPSTCRPARSVETIELPGTARARRVGRRPRARRHADADADRHRRPRRRRPRRPVTATPTPGRHRQPATTTRRADGDRHAPAGPRNTAAPQAEARREASEAPSRTPRPRRQARATNAELDEARSTQPDCDPPQRRRLADARPTRPSRSPTPGAARIGVPNFFIDKFRIPPFLLPIYQAAGIEYGVRWEVLAAINEIETDYGRNLNVSSAGALGWMQFMPASWEAYGVDGNQDGLKDPYNPVDAIFAAARYLKRRRRRARTCARAIFAYNHADWYVDSVLLRARLIGGLPADLVGSLTGLTQGRFPVAGEADLRRRGRARATSRSARRASAAPTSVESSAQRDGIRIFAKRGAPVVAVNDGRIVAHRPHAAARQLRRRCRTSTATRTRTRGSASVVERYPVPKPPHRHRRGRRAASSSSAARRRARRPGLDDDRGARPPRARRARSAARASRAAAAPPTRPAPTKERLFANPDAPARRGRRRRRSRRSSSGEDFGAYLNRVFGLDRADVDMKPLERGARVTAGTVLGRIGKRRRARRAPHVLLRDPPRRPRRAADRPEADPRRLEAARVDRDLPRGGPQPVRRRGRRRRRRSARSC